MDADMLLVMAGWFTGSLVTGLCGIGGALIAIPLMLFIMPMREAVLVSCIAGLPLVGAMGLWYMRRCRRDVLLRLLLGAVPGAFAGLHLLQTLPGQALQAVLGVLIIVFIAGMHFGGNRPPFRDRPAVTVMVGVLCGTIGTAINVDGPIIALYGLMAAWPPPVFLGITSCFYMSRCAVTCLLQWQAGLYTPEVLHWALYAIPAGLAGFAVSIPLVRRIPVSRFRNMVKLVLVVAGISCLIRAF